MRISLHPFAIIRIAVHVYTRIFMFVWREALRWLCRNHISDGFAAIIIQKRDYLPVY